MKFSLMKRNILLVVMLLTQSVFALAKEGMWIPSLLSAVYDDMKAAGLQLTEADLYDVNHSSLKDAIVLFDGGCTGEIVSDQGLLFTNHHCGFDQIQFHSSLEHDYLKDGFWAMNPGEELRCDGLTVMFIVRMDDVTFRMREGIQNGMSMTEMDAIISKNRKLVEEEYKKNNPKLGLQIKAFNYGNQYFAIVTKTYTDVRLVGAPPGDVGKFGGDTDNWVWPRHTGDFSVFRIYADQNNEPAAYSQNNVPFKPAHFLPVNIGGVKEGDYSMVYGFPGRTDHLLTSYSVDFITKKSNPMRIDFRDQSLAVLKEKMRSSDEIRIKYAAKQSGIANAWKKWQGQQIGLTNIDAVKLKQDFEKEYQQKANQKGNEAYAGLLGEIKTVVTDMEVKNLKSQAFVEFVYYGPELFNFAHQYRDLIENFDTLKAKGNLQPAIDKLKTAAKLFYKDFDLSTEKAIYAALEPMYTLKYSTGLTDSKMAIPVRDAAYVNARYDKSIFRDSTSLFKLLDKFSKSSAKKMSKDYFYKQAVTMFDEYNKNLRPGLSESQKRLDFLMQQYTEGMMKMFPADYWSDANSTLRITFGKVEGSEPRDGEMYKFFTTSDGILAKNATKNPDFELNDRLQELFRKREYGQYAEGGELHVCYTGSNHTTGGNSGSPALNAKGELTGINFDRSWESTMSDIVYNSEICRNIMVDIRYVLWVIDVYANADYLLNEMKIVK
jgi:hypothetical protein